jgi:hypothetical protein
LEYRKHWDSRRKSTPGYFRCNKKKLKYDDRDIQEECHLVLDVRNSLEQMELTSAVGVFIIYVDESANNAAAEKLRERICQNGV